MCKKYKYYYIIVGNIDKEKGLPTQFDIENAAKLKELILNNDINPYLYKYYDINACDRFLDNSCIMFSSYDKFNDPFEFSDIIDMNYSKSDINKIITISKDVNIFDNMFNTKKHLIDNIITKSIEEEKKKLGIFCASSSKDNLLLWAHYADSHKGICLEFDIKKSPETFILPQKVVYNDQYPHYNYFKERDQIMKPLFHKSNVWSYEEEFRIIKVNQPNILRDVNKEALSGVIFGCCCDKEERNRIMRKCKTNGFNSVKFYEAVKDKMSYKLTIISIFN